MNSSANVSAPSHGDVPTGRTIAMLVGLIAGIVLVTAIGATPALADDQERGIRFENERHTIDSGRHVVAFDLVNTTSQSIDFRGVLTLASVEGDLVSEVQTPPMTIEAGQSLDLAVPIAMQGWLDDGRYVTTLTLVSQTDGYVFASGPREIRVGSRWSMIPGFPGSLLLAAGAVMIGASFWIGRGSPAMRKRHAVPDVAAVRRVEVTSAQAPRPATVKQLVPPRFRQDQ